ncbi:folylpolyglutamate synthase, mitochondrial [Anastrepha obliqua]|uniref:folylpolyglutamate synthase, mitochondrial n=1 Tax=Anastrepha obliqua TaxID=95512 RepID=UPI0024099A30|nr:folylpolyglutamate synthase, mitochondrial [Anastrepha obliqua]
MARRVLLSRLSATKHRTCILRASSPAVLLQWRANTMLSTEKPTSVVMIPQGIAVATTAAVAAAKTFKPPMPTAARCFAVQKHAELSVEEQYEECISDLNTLQSNAITIRRSILLNNKQLPLTDMFKYMERSGLSLEELEKIPFIHVSGTKGKGSTCALTESILRAHGVKTGFFSSPHLLSVTERLRLNGQSISKQKFVRTFRRVYDRLRSREQYEGDMPAYFKFLTILSFHVFLEEKVQVIIMEVGIGGELDCTNVIRNTKTIGITSLGLEHTHLLGDTLHEIAWQKAGIIKDNADVYTSVTQKECLDVINERAKEHNANLHIVPEYRKYFRKPKIEEMLANLNEVIQLNGSLAIQLAYDWLRKNGYSRYKQIEPTELTTEVESGLQQCNWPGRCQISCIENFNFHIDGAHTVESIRVCCDWFKRVTEKSTNPRILIFNTTGERDSRRLLEVLYASNEFAIACFAPNISSGASNHNDNTTVYSITEQLKRARLHSSIWYQFCMESEEADTSKTFGSILDCLQHLRAVYGTQQPVDVLVTGSLHLIGATMAAFKDFQHRSVTHA